MHRAVTEKIIFGIYLFLFAAMAVTLALIQPLDPLFPLLPNPPDEFTRYVIPLYIFETGAIPTGFEDSIQIAGYGGSYAFLPILPYIIMGYFMKIVGLFSTDRAVLLISARMINVLSGLLMAVVVRCISKRVFPDARFGWLFAYAVMFWPEQLFIHTYVNVESMSNLSIALILLALLCIYQDGISRRNCFLLSIGMILCLLTYYNAYGYVLIGTILFFLYFPLHKDRFEGSLVRHIAGYALPVFLLTAVGAGWWFVRNLILFDGDLWGLSTMAKVRADLGVMLPPTYLQQGKSILQMFRENDLFNRMVTTYICCYGAASIYAGPGLYLFYKAFLCIGILSVAVFSAGQKTASKSRMIWHICMGSAIAMVCLLWLVYAYAMDYQPQGRYLLAMILPFTYYVTEGWRKLAGRLKAGDKLLNIAAALGIGLILYWEFDFIAFTMLPVCAAG